LGCGFFLGGAREVRWAFELHWAFELDGPDSVDGVGHWLLMDVPPGVDAILGFGTVPHHLWMVPDKALYLPTRVEVQHKVGVLRLPLAEDQPLGFEAFHPANPAR
jgi:hypothetical protein